MHDSSTTGIARRMVPGPIGSFVGNRIRQRREELGLSIKDIERKTNIVAETVERYEAGQERIKPMQLYQIAEALAVPLARFYIDSNENDKNADDPRHEDARASAWLAALPSRRETAKLLRIYYGISEFSVRKDVLTLLERISCMLRTKHVTKTRRKP